MQIISAFHGALFQFTLFCVPKSGVHFGTYEQAAHALTIKLARLPLKVFSSLNEDTRGQKGQILQVKLSVSRILHVKDARTSAGWSKLIRRTKKEGYDSLSYQNEFEGRLQEISYVVFNPDQIEILGIVQ